MFRMLTVLMATRLVCLKGAMDESFPKVSPAVMQSVPMERRWRNLFLILTGVRTCLFWIDHLPCHASINHHFCPRHALIIGKIHNGLQHIFDLANPPRKLPSMILLTQPCVPLQSLLICLLTLILNMDPAWDH